MTKVTRKSFIDKFPDNDIAYEDLMDGSQLSDCLLPCTRTHVETRIVMEKWRKTNYSVFDLSFSPTIQITTTRFPEFILAKFLSDLGGSLGLWLGLSVFHLTEMIFKYFMSRLKE